MQITDPTWDYSKTYGAGYLTLAEGEVEGEAVEYNFPNATLLIDRDLAGNILGVEVISE